MKIFTNLLKNLFEKAPNQPTFSTQAAVASVTKSEEPAAAATPPPADEKPEEAESIPTLAEPVDIAEVLDGLNSEHPEDLDWRQSIVDLMKLVGMDSSYGERKELAIELGYSQADIDSKGSAEMNMWLHKQVLKKLSENGGKVPAELLD